MVIIVFLSHGNVPLHSSGSTLHVTASSAGMDDFLSPREPLIWDLLSGRPGMQLVPFPNLQGMNVVIIGFHAPFVFHSSSPYPIPK